MLARNADLNNNDIFPYPLSKLFTNAFPSKWRLRNERRIPYWWRFPTRIWVVLLIGWKKTLSQSEALPRSG